MKEELLPMPEGLTVNRMRWVGGEPILDLFEGYFAETLISRIQADRSNWALSVALFAERNRFDFPELFLAVPQGESIIKVAVLPLNLSRAYEPVVQHLAQDGFLPRLNVFLPPEQWRRTSSSLVSFSIRHPQQIIELHEHRKRLVQEREAKQRAKGLLMRKPR